MSRDLLSRLGGLPEELMLMVLAFAYPNISSCEADRQILEQLANDETAPPSVRATTRTFLGERVVLRGAIEVIECANGHNQGRFDDTPSMKHLCIKDGRDWGELRYLGYNGIEDIFSRLRQLVFLKVDQALIRRFPFVCTPPPETDVLGRLRSLEIYDGVDSCQVELMAGIFHWARDVTSLKLFHLCLYLGLPVTVRPQDDDDDQPLTTSSGILRRLKSLHFEDCSIHDCQALVRLFAMIQPGLSSVRFTSRSSLGASFILPQIPYIQIEEILSNACKDTLTELELAHNAPDPNSEFRLRRSLAQYPVLERLTVLSRLVSNPSDPESICLHIPPSLRELTLAQQDNTSGDDLVYLVQSVTRGRFPLLTCIRILPAQDGSQLQTFKYDIALDDGTTNTLQVMSVSRII